MLSQPSIKHEAQLDFGCVIFFWVVWLMLKHLSSFCRHYSHILHTRKHTHTHTQHCMLFFGFICTAHCSLINFHFVLYWISWCLSLRKLSTKLYSESLMSQHHHICYFFSPFCSLVISGSGWSTAHSHSQAHVVFLHFHNLGPLAFTFDLLKYEASFDVFLKGKGSCPLMYWKQTSISFWEKNK